MGILAYPRLPMYWRTSIAPNKISALMTRDRFLTLRNALNVVESDTPLPGTDNPLWKVQPMIDKIKDGSRKQERAPGFYSIDVKMIPYRCRCALRQVVMNKLRPTGLKNFMLYDLMLDFEIYKRTKMMFSGKEGSLGLGPSIIFHLAKSVPSGSCVYHDWCLTTIPLLKKCIIMVFTALG
ncbi:PiggyBac transposable element-derived protein 3 [Eumeta japonica]|uniref:PiggyBac transposable element-derived protein 3 n=1 Tax=Eumeta variegata TaxID=151549 RepID=A0A4C1XUP4_EUMVA|nr:PiggyBac transposable element-derived protein 3 [Eumeta japonica]